MGPATSIPSSSASATSSAWSRCPSLAGLAVARRREEGGADPLLGARPEQVGVGGGRGAHEDEVDGVVGQLGDVGHDLDAEHVAGFAARAVDRARVARREDVVEAHEAELARVGRHPRDEHAPRLEQRLEAGRVHRHQLISTSASTATGRPSTTMSGLRSALTIDGSAAAASERPTSTSTSAARSTARLAADLTEQPLGGEVVDHLEGVLARDRHQPEGDVGQRLGEDPADAEHHGHPELLVAVQPGDQLPVAAEHRRHEEVHLSVVGSRGGQQLGGGRRDGVVVRQPEAHEARARSCARCRRRRA